LNGLAKKKGSGSVLRSFVYGKEDENRDAFLLPVAVAVGGDGRVAVADMGRKCVHLLVPAEERYLRLVGSERERIGSPVGLIFDEEARLYLSDSAGRVFAFGADGALRFTLRRAGEKPLLRPTGLAYSPAKRLLYVVDTLAHEVHAFGTNGEYAFSFGRRGEEPGAFNFPTHAFRSAAGEIYVTDALNFRIAIFDESGKPLGSFGRHGDGSGDLAMPKGLAVDRDGVVYVADGLFDNVQLFSRSGDFLLTLGQRGVEFGEFWLPSGVFVSGSGELYVCDTYNGRIQVFRITEGYGDGASS
jgi:DNA-binding beta-propeller fold protein YncE